LRSSSDEVAEVIDDLRKLGVVKAAPTHCTGDEAMEAFRDAFADGFTTLGVGAVVEIGG
jgi:7,8-dihydropterin-6-yl-methyl-4-(beta-D-ribofuranosyl)aminobenzene 5'-phosphate synthase